MWTLKKYIITSSEQIENELIETEEAIFAVTRNLCETIIKQNSKKSSKAVLEMAQMMKVQLKRRKELIYAFNVIQEFEWTVPKSENFTKVTENQLKRCGL